MIADLIYSTKLKKAMEINKLKKHNNMRNLYFNSIIKKFNCLTVILVILGISNSATAQLKVPFTPRTSQYSPTQKIYNVKGDFVMLGNTNLTLQNYGATTPNNNNTMVYVDVDGNSITGLGGSPTFNSSAATLSLSTENGANPACSNIVYAGLYWTGRAEQSGTASNTFNVTKTINGTSYTKAFNKRKIMLKGPGTSAYQEFTANAADIFYPTTSANGDYIYSAYKEVTDYVRLHGIGEYIAADIALKDGNGGGTGYSGGWGLVVVYENTKMKYRDVSIFDGHAFVVSTNTSGFDLPVSGFNTVRTGNVGVKLGLMASEGDVNLTGDYFKIRNGYTTNYTTLSRATNGVVPNPDNFFNSSIRTGGNARNPNIVNNTGIDIAMFDIPNTNNAVIVNEQTETNFRYGTGGDTYAIFALAMSVDAYIPEAEAILATTTINNQPAVQPYTILPNQEAGFTIDVKNLGSEAINNYKVIVPLPYNATYVAGSATGTIFYNNPNTTITGTYDPNLGVTGSIVWDFGTLPLPANPTTLLARLSFKIQATNNCEILANASCSSVIAVNGNSVGVGNITNVPLKNSNLIQGYTQNGTCVGQAIPSPINIGINGTSFVEQNCPGTNIVRNFSFCSSSTTVLPSQIASNFPIGSEFYDSFPVTGSSIQYTETLPIPLVAGSTLTYYAVPSGGGSGCRFPFTISKCPTIIAQNDALAGGNGTTGNTNAGNVLNNNGSGSDTLNGVQATITQVNITVTTPAVSIGGAPVPVINTTTGVVSVPPGTPAGTYTITYNLCEKLNPLTNCDPAIVTITVTAPAIIAQDDTLSGGNGTTDNTNAGNVLNNNGNGNDTLNGANAVITAVNIAVTTPAVSIGGAPVPVLNTTTGIVSVPAGTPAGTYTIVYNLCEKINPTTNCDPATVTITVTAPAIIAQDDTLSGGNGTTGNTNAGNVLNNNGNGNDTLNGANAVITAVNIAVTTPAVSIGGAPVPVLNTTTGIVSVPAGTPAGTYTIVYNLCEKINPLTNCDPATVTITVTAPAIIAQDDTLSGGNGTTGNTNAGNVLSNNGNGNDTLNGTNADITAVNIAVTTPAVSIGGAPVPVLNTTTGIVSVPAGTPAGTYTIVYNLCEKLNPTTNCDPATVTITVTAPAIIAQDDTLSGGNGTTGTPNAGNVLNNNGNGNDTLNGANADITAVNIAVTTPAVSVGGAPVPVLNTTTGIVSVPAGTPAGTYTIVYNLCEKLNPTTNCDPATVTITVTAPVIIAQDDTLSGGNGIVGNTNAGNVLNNNGNGNDTLNGANAVITAVNIAVTTPAVSIGGAPVPVLNTTTGIVSVPAGTPSGTYTIVYNLCEKLNPTTNCDPAVVTITVYTPSIELLKNGTYVDSSAPPGVSVGDTVVYNFTVTNTGSAPLTIITVTDPLVTVLGGPLASLAIGDSDSTTFTAVYTINQNDIDAGQVNNLATATGTPPTGPPVTDISSDPTPCTTCNPVPNCPTCTITPLPQVPSISITKDGTYTDTTAPFGETNVGDTVVYNFVVTNTGNITLTNITVTDNNAVMNGGTLVSLPSLAPGESNATTFTAVHVITQADINAGVVFNLATATGTPPTGPPVTGTSTDPTPCTTCPSNPTCPTCTATPLIKAVDDVYSGVSCNVTGITGNILSNDTLGGQAVNTNTASQVTLTILSGNYPNISIAGNGNINFTAGVPAGSYTYTYQICNLLLPNVCDQATVTINVLDTIAPVVTPAINATVQCDGNGNAAALAAWLANNGGATATDPCSAITWTNNFAGLSDGCGNTGAASVTFTAADASGNQTPTTAVFTIVDNDAPTITTAASNSTVQCTANSSTASALTAWLASNGGAVASDICSNVTWSNNFTALSDSCGNTGSATVVFTAKDDCNNESTTTATFTIEDTTSPTFTAPANTEIFTSATCTFDASVTITGDVTNEADNCSTGLQATFTDSTADGTCAGSKVITRTWNLVDACGNAAASQTQTITVTDNTAPIFTTPAGNLVVQCGNGTTDALQLWLNSNGGAVATDNCSTVTWSNNFNSISNDCSTAVTIIFTATDACNNAASSTATFTIEDTTAPTFTAPASIEIFTTATCTYDSSVAITGDVTNEADNCAVLEATFTDSIADGTCTGSKVITRTWNLVDACGNAATPQTQTITVTDNITPTFTAPTNTEIFTTADCTFDASVAITGDVTNEADNCSTGLQATFTDSIADGTCPGAKVITRTWNLVDACGNAAASQTQTITITDNTAPTFTAPANTEVFTTATCTYDASIAITGDVTNEADNCSTGLQATFTDSIADGTCTGSKVITRTWTLVDACGNAAAPQTQTITVTDNIAPTFTAPTDITISTGTDCTFDSSVAITGDVTNEADNCSTGLQATFTDSIADGTCAGSKVITRTWTLVDSCGNTAAPQIQTINVIDNIAPVVPAAPASTVASCIGEVPEMITLTALDNCNGAITVSGVDTTVPGSCANSFVVTRTWTFVDACNNTSSVSQTITVNDTIAPTFDQATPADTNASCDNIPAPAVLTATDNCGTATVSMTETTLAGNCPSNYTIVRTWIATDVCGNSSTPVTQNIAVSDTNGPTLVGDLDTKLQVFCNDIPAIPTLEFTDNCTTVGTPVFTETTTDVVNGIYDIIRTWTVADACGNVSTFTQVLHVTQVTLVTEVIKRSCINEDLVYILRDLLPNPELIPVDAVWVNEDNLPIGFTGTTFNAFGNPLGVYTFSYTIIGGPCPIKIEIKMTIDADCGALPCELIVIHNAFTPNGDGINEFFNIENIEDFDCYPANKVEIYNRWGVLVYETNNYDNSSKRFEGISEGRATLDKSSELPTGTYFYIIQYKTTDGQTVNKDGYLYLTR